MALTQAHVALIRSVQNLSKNILEMRNRIQQADELYNGDGDMNASITDADLATYFPGSGLTEAQLSAAIYALKILKQGGDTISIDGSVTPFSIVANLP
jgi:hypothetical protein